MSNMVFIATSLDGYIADKEGKLYWLNEIPNPNNIDCGFDNFMSRIDAIVMGRNTFEAVISFDCEWPYNKPVFLLSNSLKSIPNELISKVELVSGSPIEIVNKLNKSGYSNLYIDGGITIQKFLQANLIDELIISRLPILLGAGSRLFGNLINPIRLDHIGTKVFLNAVVQSHYVKKNL